MVAGAHLLLMRPGVAAVLGRVQRMSLPDAAAAYAAAGVAVLPCAPGQKRPLTRHGLIEASVDIERVRSWWRRWPDANVGLASGHASGFVALDIDVRSGGSGFAALRRARAAGFVDGWTALVRTPSGGLHLYFACGEQPQASWSLPAEHLDFRGQGGYVIAPPSCARDGHAGRRDYQLIAAAANARELDAVALRQFLAPAMSRARPARQDMSDSQRRLAAWLAGQPEGNRNRALFWAACRQAEAGVAEAEARELLRPAAARCGLEEREIEATLSSAFRVSRRGTGEPSSLGLRR